MRKRLFKKILIVCFLAFMYPAFRPFSVVNTLSHTTNKTDRSPFSLLSALSAGLMDGNYAASTTLYRLPFSVCIRSAPIAAHHLAETHHRHAAHSGRITALQNGENDRSRIEFELLSCLGQTEATVEHLLLYGHGIELAVAQLQFRFLFGRKPITLAAVQLRLQLGNNCLCSSGVQSISPSPRHKDNGGCP